MRASLTAQLPVKPITCHAEAETTPRTSEDIQRHSAHSDTHHAIFMVVILDRFRVQCEWVLLHAVIAEEMDRLLIENARQRLEKRNEHSQHIFIRHIESRDDEVIDMVVGQHIICKSRMVTNRMAPQRGTYTGSCES